MKLVISIVSSSKTLFVKRTPSDTCGIKRAVAPTWKMILSSNFWFVATLKKMKLSFLLLHVAVFAAPKRGDSEEIEPIPMHCGIMLFKSDFYLANIRYLKAQVDNFIQSIRDSECVIDCGPECTDSVEEDFKLLTFLSQRLAILSEKKFDNFVGFDTNFGDSVEVKPVHCTELPVKSDYYLAALRYWKGEVDNHLRKVLSVLKWDCVTDCVPQCTDGIEENYKLLSFLSQRLAILNKGSKKV